MAAADSTQAIREKALEYPGVDEGTACTQSSFKAGGKAFLFIGMQGGRYKAMLKLKKSIPQATKLAEAEPDVYQVGKPPWVTARFTAEIPIPKRIWTKWLDENYELTVDAGGKSPAARKKAAGGRRTTRKKATKSKVARKKSPVKKKATKRNSTGRGK